MNNSNELINRINEKYSSMSKGQKLLSTYITDNYDKAVFLTAEKLGKVVGVSESTVVRFATSWSTTEEDLMALEAALG